MVGGGGVTHDQDISKALAVDSLLFNENLHKRFQCCVVGSQAVVGLCLCSIQQLVGESTKSQFIRSAY